MSTLEGTEATATLSVYADTLCHRCPLIAWVVDENGAMVETTWEISLVEPNGLEVTITETNAPVAAGEFLEVVAAVENTGTETSTQSVRLVVGEEVVDTTSVTVSPGESQSVALGYETYPVEEDVSFPVAVESGDEREERTVEVYADRPAATFEVAITETNAPVAAGEFLEVTTRVENTGAEEGTETVRLEAGGEVVDTASVTLSAGETGTVRLGYETYPVRRTVEFPVTVSSPDDVDEQVVTVFGTE